MLFYMVTCPYFIMLIWLQLYYFLLFEFPVNLYRINTSQCLSHKLHKQLYNNLSAEERHLKVYFQFEQEKKFTSQI